MTVYSEVTKNMIAHRGEPIVKCDYLKGLLAYISLSEDLPSYNSELLSRKISSISSESDNKNRLSGKIKITQKQNQSLEQITEEHEDNYMDDDDVEEYRIDQINMKDTLLTIDKSDFETDSNNDNRYSMDEVKSETFDEGSLLLNFGLF